MCKLQAANHKTQSLQQPAKAAADQHHAHTQHSHTTQVISNILKACVELMAGSDCAMQAKAHMGAHHSSPTQLHTSLLHSQRQLVTHNIGVPMKQATWGHQGSTHHTLFQGGRAGQNDQPAAAGQCVSCKLQTTKPKACSNQLRQQQISTMHTLNIHTQHK